MANRSLPAKSSARLAEPVYSGRVHRTMEAVRDIWLRCETEGYCTAFQRYRWVEGIVRELMPKGGNEALFVEIHDTVTDEPLMLFPLLRSRRFGYSEITWLSCGVCDYSAPLLATRQALSRGQAEAAWAALKTVLPSADRIHIDSIPREIAVGVENPLALLRIADLSAMTTSGMPISGPAESLIDRVCKPSFAKDMKKKARRLEQAGTVHIDEAKTAEQLDLIYGVLVAQRLKRFHEVGRFDILTRKAYVDFYHDCARQGLSDGSVRVLGVRVNDDWVATCYVLVHAGRMNGILLAMDQDRWSRISPGLFIVAKAMEWSRREGLDYFDMSVGSLHYKESVGADTQSLFVIDETNTVLGRAVAAASARVERLRTWLKERPEIYARLRSARSRLRQFHDRIRGKSAP